MLSTVWSLRMIPNRFHRYFILKHSSWDYIFDQVESPTKLDEKEKVAVVSDVAKAFNEHYNAINVLARHHFAEDSDDSEVEDVNMDTDYSNSPSKPESASAEDTSNLQLAWEMLELAKVL